MSDYAVILEMRKKYLGFWHLFHLLLTLGSGGVWLVVWIVHWLICNSHNQKINRQIDRIMDAQNG